MAPPPAGGLSQPHPARLDSGGLASRDARGRGVGHVGGAVPLLTLLLPQVLLAWSGGPSSSSMLWQVLEVRLHAILLRPGCARPSSRVGGWHRGALAWGWGERPTPQLRRPRALGRVHNGHRPRKRCLECPATCRFSAPSLCWTALETRCWEAVCATPERPSECPGAQGPPRSPGGVSGR